MPQEIWRKQKIISWSQLLLKSYEKLFKSSLLDRKGTSESQAKTLFLAPFIVVSHGTESDPILNYGNQTALNLWELNWEDFIQTPSRLTAEPANREERERMLKTTVKQGFINHYRGIRISSNLSC